MITSTLVRKRVSVRGTVQGVGMRPFVHRLAMRHSLTGWVFNRGGEVEIEIQGKQVAIDSFVRALRDEAPPLAAISAIDLADAIPDQGDSFRIVESSGDSGTTRSVPADSAPCDDCLSELFDPGDRRYRYPFINCTNCGPRFTIIENLPYDRARTTMRQFSMCAACQREYLDPTDRRFHAEPIACPECGPRLWLESGEIEIEGDAVDAAVSLLSDGQIVAIKGIGGFHLACDASSSTAVRALRERKHRPAKPFAVMFPTIEDIRAICQMNDVEARLISSRERPIVLLQARQSTAICAEVAPRLHEIGAMLPSTPLHVLLLREFDGPLVMTSGNLSEEPIVATNEEARDRLEGVADAFLMHDRDIASRYDDSVVRVWEGDHMVIRRARGLAPTPALLPFESSETVLALGGHLKSTFCLAHGGQAYLSQHLGDLDNAETMAQFLATRELYEHLFELRPDVLVHDLHPEYLSTKMATAQRDARLVGVQHHHAHMVSCLAEHGLSGPAIGVAFDGLGYGTDGNLWGGEVLVADSRQFARRAHLRQAPMPGAAAAIRKPYRMAVAYLDAWLSDEPELYRPFVSGLDAHETTLIRQQIRRQLNAPLTSSCGRLFDAVSSILGICSESTYEGQAAIELEAAADPSAEGSYSMSIIEARGGWIMDPEPVLRAILRDQIAGAPIGAIAMRFHRAIAEAAAGVCEKIAAETGLRQVALVGGVFQNTLLLSETATQLRARELEPLISRSIPTNDGGLSYGQAVVALSRLAAERGSHG